MGADVGGPHHPWASLTGRTTVCDELEEDSPRFGQSRPITAPGSEIATALSSQTGISPINFTPMHRSIHRAMIKTPNAKPGLFRDVRWHRVITARQIFCRHVSLEKCTSILRNNLPVSRYAPVQEHAPTRQIPPDQHRRDATPTKYDYALVLNGEHRDQPRTARCNSNRNAVWHPQREGLRRRRVSESRLVPSRAPPIFRSSPVASQSFSSPLPPHSSLLRHISTIHSLLLFRSLGALFGFLNTTARPRPPAPPFDPQEPPATRTFEVIPGSHHVWKRPTQARERQSRPRRQRHSTASRTFRAGGKRR